MSNSRSLLILGVLLIVAALMLSGTPLQTLSHANAQYAAYSEFSAEVWCGGPASYQIRVYSSADIFADPGLKQKLFTAANGPGKTRQKFLICNDSLKQSAYRIFTGYSIGFISPKAGDVVPRYYSDSQ